jgi:hypothetical protein
MDDGVEDMKRPLALLAPAMLLCAIPAARADAGAIDLCAHEAVRDVARLESDLKPVKEIYGIVTNPTGFALKQVNDHVMHIPKWVGYAMDPQGAVRAKVIDMARSELKRQVGLRDGCAAALHGDSAVEVPDPTTLLPLERDV